MSFYRTSSFEGNFAEEIYDLLVSSFSLLPILCLALDGLMWCTLILFILMSSLGRHCCNPLEYTILVGLACLELAGSLF